MRAAEQRCSTTVRRCNARHRLVGPGIDSRLCSSPRRRSCATCATSRCYRLELARRRLAGRTTAGSNAAYDALERAVTHVLLRTVR